jgi:TRAP-type mannitol/chloroaromatic compound transport system permease small subunit
MFVRTVDNIMERVGRIVSYLILVMVGIVMFEIIMRYGFNSPTFWVHDMSSWLQVTYVMLGGAFTLLHKKHVRVDIFYRRYSPRLKAAVDLTVSSLCFFVFALLVLWTSTQMAWASTKMLEVSSSGLWDGPVWPFKWMLPVGIALIIVMWIAEMVRSVMTLKSGVIVGSLYDGELGESTTGD